MSKKKPVAVKSGQLMKAGPKQLEFIREADAFINLAIGGYGTGKSVAATTKFLGFAELFPPDKDIAIIGVTQQAVMRNVVRPIILPFWGEDKCRDQVKTEQRILLPDGRQCHVIGAADADSEDRIAGMNLAALLIDEVTRIHKKAFSQALNRMRVAGARVFATTNTDSPSHWFKRDYIDKMGLKDEEGNPLIDMKAIHFDLEDNPSLTKSWKKQQKNRLKSQGKAEYDRGISGLWADHSGMIYDLDGVFGQPPESDTLDGAIGCDWATDHAAVFLKLEWKVDPDLEKPPVTWVTDELVLNTEGENMAPHELAEEFRKWIAPGIKKEDFNPKRVPRVHIDPSALAMKIALRKRLGVSVWDWAESGTSTGLRNVDAGISAVAEAFHEGRLKISHRCQFLIDSLRSYVWDEKATEKGQPQRPKKDGPDDACDALRYAVVHNIHKWF